MATFTDTLNLQEQRVLDQILQKYKKTNPKIKIENKTQPKLKPKIKIKIKNKYIGKILFILITILSSVLLFRVNDYLASLTLSNFICYGYFRYFSKRIDNRNQTQKEKLAKYQKPEGIEKRMANLKQFKAS